MDRELSHGSAGGASIRVDGTLPSEKSSALSKLDQASRPRSLSVCPPLLGCLVGYAAEKGIMAMRLAGDEPWRSR